VAASGPNFSPFPFARLRRLGRREAAIESSLARWFAAGRLGAKVAALAGGPVRARFEGILAGPPDPHAAYAEVRHGGAAILVAASSRPVRALAQRLLGGAAELDAARPPTVAEHAIWALAVGAALVDLGVGAEVWPCPGGPGEAGAGEITVGFVVELPPGLGALPMTVTARCAPELLLRAPPVRTLHAWRFDLPIVVGRCALPRAGVGGLATRDVITIERCLELDLGTGGIGLSAAPGAVEARVATEYVARDMAQLDHAMLEVTVQLGTARLSLRQLGELAIGLRIVSIADQPDQE
jgi:hypothetical protein